MWFTINWYDVSSTFSIYPWLHPSLQKKTYYHTLSWTQKPYHHTHMPKVTLFIYKNPSALVQGLKTPMCDNKGIMMIGPFTFTYLCEMSFTHICNIIDNNVDC
jgi:hypothetical protein